MQIILGRTLGSTGTRFVCNLFKNLESPEKVLWMGDGQFSKRGREKLWRLDCKDFDKSWVEENIVAYLTEEEKRSKSLVIVHSHIPSQIDPMFSSLSKVDKPCIPVFSTIRDPLLVLHTQYWTDYALWGNEKWKASYEERKNKTVLLSERLIDIFTHQDKIFVYPIGIDKNLILNKFEKKAKEWEVSLSLKLKNLIKQNNFVGTTKSSRHLKARKGEEEFLKIKNSILSSRTDSILNIYDVEYSLLKADEKLKSCFIEAGYKDLSWY